jgi:hypothetical protein
MGFRFVDHLPFAECIPQIRGVYQWYSDITDGKVLGCQPGEVLCQSINSLFLLRFRRHTPYAEALLAMLNEGIAEISATDGASDLAAKYSIPGVKLPGGALPPPKQ